jgi:hypothetical protein
MGRNPSPVPRRLEKTPSWDTLSSRERAVFPKIEVEEIDDLIDKLPED